MCAIERELQAVLASAIFRDAEALKRLLRYSVEHTLGGQGTELKEYRVGVEVFGRDPSFDPRIDPVVRMAARRLRVKLAEYYAGQGRSDLIHIDIPKGGYAATFTPAQQPRLPSARRRFWGFAVYVALAAVICVLILLTVRRAARHEPTLLAVHSVVVLPFQNLSGDPSQDYLADGITEELVTDLAQIHALRVISRTSAFTYKGSKKNLAEIARELDVDAVVEGSVARSGERIRVTAQLIAASNDAHIWAQTYEGSFTDLLDLQSRVAQAVVEQVGVKLTPHEGVGIKAVRLVNPQAHEAYLLGRYYWNQRKPGAILKSLELYGKATRLDPNYAEAYAAIASAYVGLFATDNFSPRDVEAKARTAAETAIAIDDSLAEPHAVLGMINAAENYDWAGSEREFRKAFEREPSYSAAHHWYGYTLMYRGREVEAVQQLQEALRLDPINPVLIVAINAPLMLMGREQEALQQLRKELAIDPHYYYAVWGIGQVYTNMGKYDEAVSAFHQALALVPGDPQVISRLCVALARQGHRSQAMQMFEELQRSRQGQYLSGGLQSWVYASLGDNRRAVDALESAYRDRSITALMLREHYYDPIRQEARFQALAKATGLN